MRIKPNNWQWMLILMPALSMAQVSEYRDCSSIEFEEISSGPLTREEEIALLDDLYYAKVSDLTRCEQASDAQSESASAQGGADGGAGSSKNSSAAQAGSVGEGAQMSQAASEATLSEAQSMSDNRLLPGETPVAITDAPIQQAAAGDNSEDASVNQVGKGTTGSKGRAHEALETVDNRAVLRAQIKAQADIETDPVIKRKLMEQYEALK